MAILRIVIVPAGWIFSTVLLFSCVVLILGVSRSIPDEIRGVIKFCVHHLSVC